MPLTSPRFASNARLQRAAENNPAMFLWEPDHKAVQILQQALHDLDYPMPVSFGKSGGPDGLYGPETRSTVKSFQKDQGFSAPQCDGWAGRQTLGQLDRLFQKPSPVPPPPPPPPPPAPIVRKRASSLSQVERNAYITAVQALMNDTKPISTYGKFVGHHVAMTKYLMHSAMFQYGSDSWRKGFGRFLTWHRAYLWAFEKELKKQDPWVFVPYWSWATDQSFPNWLESGVKPNGQPLPGFLNMRIDFQNDLTGNLESQVITRTTGQNDRIPTVAEVNDCLNQSDYFNFTLLLENGDGRPPTPWDTLQPPHPGPHNRIHRYVGGSMNTMASPADPVFWMHHAEVDRLWYKWQQTHQNEAPVNGQHVHLQGTAESVMDPMDQMGKTFDDFQDISKLGYTYDDLTL